ncbi:unnamed protein product [Camellia sinensis]
MYDYFGYGQSSGKPSEQNTYADTEAVYKCLEESYGAKQENIILYAGVDGSNGGSGTGPPGFLREVQQDFEELPSEAFRPLRDLLNLIENISQRPPLKLEPSLAVAALAVHVPAKDWGDGGIVNWLRDEMNSHPECIPSFLELLRVLPERIPASTLASHPLVLTALSSLNSDILSEASVNVI